MAQSNAGFPDIGTLNFLSALPGGNDMEVQFNTGATFDADSGLKYDKAAKQLILGSDANDNVYMGHDATTAGGAAYQSWVWAHNNIINIQPGVDDFVYYQGYNFTPLGPVDPTKPSQWEAYEQKYEITSYGAATEHWWGNTNADGDTIRPMYHIRSWTNPGHSLFNWTATSHNWYDDQSAVAKSQMVLSNNGLLVYQVDANDPIITLLKPAGFGSTDVLNTRTADDSTFLPLIQATATNGVALAAASTVVTVGPNFETNTGGTTPGFAFDRFNANFVWRSDTLELTLGGALGTMYAKKIFLGGVPDPSYHFAVTSSVGNTYAAIVNNVNDGSFNDLRMTKTRGGAQPNNGDTIGQINFGFADFGAVGNATLSGGFRLEDFIWRTYNAALSYGERMRLDSEGYLILKKVDAYADDTAAAVGGVPVGGLYRTASAVKIRVV